MALTDLFIFIAIIVFLGFLLQVLLTKANDDLKKTLPILKEDRFFLENGHSYDFVLVFKVFDEDEQLTKLQTENSLKVIVSKIKSGGLDYKLFYSAQRDEVYVKIRATLDRLTREADRIDYKVLLDPDRLRMQAERGMPTEEDGWKWKPIHIPEDEKYSSYKPYRYIYGRYDTESKYAELFAKRRQKIHIFRGVDRIKLIITILEARTFENGCHIKLGELKKNMCILAKFPLHDYRELASLQTKWLTMLEWPWNQPLDDIKDYFGEKIGLYFLWLGHYTTWLIYPALFGVVAYINNEIEQRADSTLIPFFAAFVAIWSTYVLCVVCVMGLSMFLEFWKRKQVTHAMEWGMVGFENVEEDRPEFEGEQIESPIDGSPALYFPRDKYTRLMVFSQVVIVTLILMVVGAVSGIFVMKLFITREPVASQLTVAGVATGSLIASIANAVQIQVMNAIYGNVAKKLNDMENHQTDTVYEDNLIAKVFMFQFVNSYSALVYISFIKHYIGDYCLVSCMTELSTTLSTVFLTRLLVGNLTEICVPMIKSKIRLQKESEGIEPGTVLSPIEGEYALEEYDVLLGTFNDYAELAIQFGYASMFVAGFPLSPLLALINNYIEIRVDGWKLSRVCRRPEPRGAEDIGTWYSIIEIMSTVAVITNCALVWFTSTSFNYLMDFRSRAMYFLLSEHIIFIIKYMLTLFVTDVPPDVEMQIQRQEFLVSKVIDDVADDNDEVEEEDKSKSGGVNLRILRTDDDYVIPKNDEEEATTAVNDDDDDEGSDDEEKETKKGWRGFLDKRKGGKNDEANEGEVELENVDKEL